MGMNITFYKVVENIAQRSGLILERYRTKDMNWILDNNDLRRVRFTPDEYIDGLQGVVKITGTEADALIAENNYQMGYEGLEPNNNQQEQPQEEQEVEQEGQTETVDEQTEQNDETPENTDENAETETIEENEVGNVEDILGGGTQQDENNETSEEETENQQQNQEEE
jgi:hypothetical protein